jgi:hypothetical protein
VARRKAALTHGYFLLPLRDSFKDALRALTCKSLHIVIADEGSGGALL